MAETDNGAPKEEGSNAQAEELTYCNENKMPIFDPENTGIIANMPVREIEKDANISAPMPISKVRTPDCEKIER